MNNIVAAGCVVTAYLCREAADRGLISDWLAIPAIILAGALAVHFFWRRTAGRRSHER